MNDLLVAMVAYFEDWLDVSDTGKGDLDGVVAEMKSLTVERPIGAQQLPVVDEWLIAATQNESAPHCEPLMAALADTYQSLRWVTVPDDYMGVAFARNFAYTQLIGSPIDDDLGTVYGSGKIAAGFSLQAPDLFYPPHFHSAVEFCGILSGLAQWQSYYNPPVFHPPGAHLFHPTEVAHAMQTLDEPLLAVWAWTGEMGAPVKIDVDGWL